MTFGCSNRLEKMHLFLAEVGVEREKTITQGGVEENDTAIIRQKRSRMGLRNCYRAEATPRLIYQPKGSPERVQVVVLY